MLSKSLSTSDGCTQIKILKSHIHHFKFCLKGINFNMSLAEQQGRIKTQNL